MAYKVCEKSTRKVLIKKRYESYRTNFISWLFSPLSLPIRKHFLRYSNQRQNAAATSSAVIVLLTPPQVFLRLSRVSERPASCCFGFVNKKKSTGAKSGE